MALKSLGDRNKFYIFPWYIADIAATRDMKKLVGSNVDSVFIHIKKDFITIYYDDLSTNKIGAFLLRKIIKDRKYYKLFSQRIYELSRDMENFCDGISSKDITLLSDKELLAIYGQYVKKMRNLRAWGWIPNFLDGLFNNFLTDEIMKRLKESLSEKGLIGMAGKYYSLLSSSEKMSEVQSEELARLEVLLKISKGKNGKRVLGLIKGKNKGEICRNFKKEAELLRKHLKDFSWLTFAYIGPVMTWEHLFSALQDNLDKGNLASEKKRIRSHFSGMKKRKMALIKKLKLPSDLVYLFDVSAEMMYMKDFRKSSYMKSYVAMDRVMLELSKRLGISLKEIKYLTFEEVQEALRDKKRDVLRKITKERIRECCYIVKKGKLEIHTGKRCQNILAEVSRENARDIRGDITELHGKTAYAGKVIGVAKIVLVAEDIKKMERGDILVSSSTNPDLIVAMKKAAAFVTDFGGITSHAAIVARELKKPCVVGTENGTHIIRDGDIIEVDANVGIIKIIKKDR